MSFRSLISAAVLALLAACTTHTAHLSEDRNVVTLRNASPIGYAGSYISGGEMVESLRRLAWEHCQSRELELLVLGTKGSSGTPAVAATGELSFRCVTRDDPALAEAAAADAQAAAEKTRTEKDLKEILPNYSKVARADRIKALKAALEAGQLRRYRGVGFNVGPNLPQQGAQAWFTAVQAGRALDPAVVKALGQKFEWWLEKDKTKDLDRDGEEREWMHLYLPQVESEEQLGSVLLYLSNNKCAMGSTIMQFFIVTAETPIALGKPALITVDTKEWKAMPSVEPMCGGLWGGADKQGAGTPQCFPSSASGGPAWWASTLLIGKDGPSPAKATRREYGSRLSQQRSLSKRAC